MHTYLLDYLKTQQKELNQNLKKAKETFDFDAIHDFRVNIKRIRSVFKLMEYIDPEFFNTKEMFKDVKKLFKSAGLIRDMQVQIRLILYFEEKYAIKHINFKHFLEQKEAIGRDKLINAIAKFNTEGLTKKYQYIESYLNKYFSITTENKTFALLSDRVHEVKTIADISNDEESVHDIRAKLKDVTYLLKIMSNAKHPKLESYDMSRVKDLAQKLGEWHDRVVLYYLIDIFLKSQFEPIHKVYDDYKPLYNAVVSEKNELLKDMVYQIAREMEASEKQLGLWV